MPMQKNVFDRTSLSLLGIGFKTDQESAEFEAILKEELEVRVGVEISKKLSKKQLAEFDKLPDPSLAGAWLEVYCPDYKERAKAITNELKREVLRYREQIDGHLVTFALKENGVLIDVLNLGNETREGLKEAGIYTYGEMAAIKDLGTIGSLNSNNIREIWEIIYLIRREGIESAMIPDKHS